MQHMTWLFNTNESQ